MLGRIRRFSGTKFGLTIQRIAFAIYRESCNPGYNFAENGESRVIKALNHSTRKVTIFDVGANVGHWSIACINEFGPQAIIYAFEPTSRSFAQLCSATEGMVNVRAKQIGLSSSECEMNIMVSSTTSEKSGVETTKAPELLARISDFQPERQKFVRGDSFCDKHSIEQINFLKIDTEGHDLEVLFGFDAMLRNNKIDVIQFEYNKYNIYTKRLLNDFYRFLNETCTDDGFRIGRLYPSGVYFKAYHPNDENFVDGNILAVRSDLPDLINRFSI